jgi:hypothetical protein
MDIQANQADLRQAFERENLIVFKRFGEDREA